MSKEEIELLKNIRSELRWIYGAILFFTMIIAIVLGVGFHTISELLRVG